MMGNEVFADNAKIPEDAVAYENHFYKIYDTDCTWEEARSKCESTGGHLVTITSDEEQEFVETLNESNSRAWIGGYRDDNFNWHWVTDEDWEYTNWSPGEPNNSSNVISNENRAVLWRQKWNDLNENNTGESHGYICEWEEVNDSDIDLNNSADKSESLQTLQEENKKLKTELEKLQKDYDFLLKIVQDAGLEYEQVD